MVRRSGVAVLFLAALVALAGCTEKSGTAKDPDLVAQEAIKSFGSSVSSQDGGDLKRLSGSFEPKQGSGDGFDMFASGSFDMDFEWGSNGVVHVLFGMSNGGMTMSAEAWCSETANVMKWGDEVYGGRGGSSGITYEDSMCSGSKEMEEMSSGLDLFSSEEFAELELLSIETHDDGSLTATYADPAENGTLTAKIDKKGRIIQMDMDHEEGSGTFKIEYGAREAISIPEPTARIPAQIDWRLDVANDGIHTATIYSSDDPPLDEIMARLVISDWSEGTEEIIVSFPLHAKGQQTSAGYTFTYSDADGDGRVSENDTMVFFHPEWEDLWSVEENLVLYDEWAGRNVNENPVPAVGAIPLVALGVLALAFVRRR